LAAVVVSMVFVSERARQQADNARNAQALVEHLRAVSQQFQLLSVSAINEVLAGRMSSRQAANSAFPEGARLWAQMNQVTKELTETAPGLYTDRVRRRVRSASG